jgi:DNA-binding transcriptional MerR regulator
MRVSELAARSGVPVATIKYYLRERLLPPGSLTSATQATYDDAHVERLRLIRALVDSAGLSIAQTRRVLQSVDSPPESVHDLLAVAAEAVSRPVAPGHSHERVHELMARWGWRIDTKDCTAHASLAEALNALDSAGFELPDAALEDYRAHMEQIAEREVANVPTDSPESAVQYVALGTVLIEPVLLALRRMAQQEASSRRFDTQP